MMRTLSRVLDHAPDPQVEPLHWHGQSGSSSARNYPSVSQMLIENERLVFYRITVDVEANHS